MELISNAQEIRIDKMKTIYICLSIRHVEISSGPLKASKLVMIVHMWSKFDCSNYSFAEIYKEFIYMSSWNILIPYNLFS